MTFYLNYTDDEQTMNFLDLDFNIYKMNCYIEFSNKFFVSGTTFENASINSKLLEFSIIPIDFFPNASEYDWYMYEDNTKINLLEQGKCYVNEITDKKFYERPTQVKKVYDRNK